MNARQFCLFPNEKGVFHDRDFESKLTPEFLERMKTGIDYGWDEFIQYDLEGLDPTTRASMLNNKITYSVTREFKGFLEVKCVEINGTRRRAVIYDDYIFFFKKFPVSTADGIFVNEIKMQNLDKHVITISYMVDATWTNLLSVDFQYLENKDVIYSLPVYNRAKAVVYLNENEYKEIEPAAVKLKIGLKKDAK